MDLCLLFSNWDRGFLAGSGRGVILIVVYMHLYHTSRNFSIPVKTVDRLTSMMITLKQSKACIEFAPAASRGSRMPRSESSVWEADG